MLASGRGERFVASGGQGSKLHAMLAGQRIIDRTTAAARASGLRVHVEVGGHAGMGDSIAAAVRATRDASGWLVLPGDLPLVRPESIRAVAAALNGAAVVVPHFGGAKGHPVGFGAQCLDALLALGGADGAASVVKAYEATGQVVKLPLDDEGIVTDIDALDDLARAEHMLATR